MDECRENIESLREEIARLRKTVDEREHQLVTFFDITTRVLESDDVVEQLNLVAEGITRARLFRRAIISLFDEDYSRVDVGYSGLEPEEIIEHRRKPSLPQEVWEEILSERYKIGESFFVSHNTELNARIGGIKSTLDEANFADGWHPSDMLFVPLRSSRGNLLGVISVDDPFDGTFPSHENLRLTELFAREASEIIERGDLTRKFFGMQQYLTQLIESSSDIIVSSDADGKIVLFNSGAERIFGYSAEEVEGRPISILYEDGDEARKVRQLLRENDGKIESLEVSARAKNGEVIPISMSASLLFDEKGNVIGTQGISKDLRPFKALQRNIEELQRKETIRLVAVTLSHHINNYLQSMLICGQNVEEILQDKKVDFTDKSARNSVEKYLAELKLNGMRISRLTNILSNPPEKLAIDEYLDGIKMLQLPNDMAVKIESHEHEFCTIDGVCPRILIADDEETIREGIAEFMRAHGFIVETAKDGAEAIKLIEKNYDKYLAIISDIKMPHANGYEVFRKAKELRPKLVVILMTAFGYDENHALVKASQEGLKAKLFKEKPFDMNNVLRVLRETLAEK